MLVTKQMCVKFGISITARTWPSFMKITDHGLNDIYTRFNICARSEKKIQQESTEHEESQPIPHLKLILSRRPMLYR